METRGFLAWHGLQFLGVKGNLNSCFAQAHTCSQKNDKILGAPSEENASD